MLNSLDKLWDRGWFVLTVIATTILLSALVKCESVASAADAWPIWTPEVELDVGRCLWAEDSSGKDWPAAAHALVKQWRLLGGRRPFSTQVRWYCAMWKKVDPQWDGTRPDLIRRSTWTEPLDGTVEEWAELRAFIERFKQRRVDDPCPRCIWWGGPRYDQIPAHWTCPLGPPETNNVFCYVQP
jgi:hypothetical protein